MSSYRYMRVIVFFDLPTEKASQRHEYAVFRRFLIKNGFMMMQKSVYCKLLLNGTAASAMMQVVRRHKPKEGLVQMLTITEKQYANIEFVVGEKSSNILDSTERLVVL